MWENRPCDENEASTSGRVVLPRQFLKQLGLRPGAVLDVKLEGGSFVFDAETGSTAKGKNHNRPYNRAARSDCRSRCSHPHERAGAEDIGRLSVMASVELTLNPHPLKNQHPKGAAPALPGAYLIPHR